MKKLIPIILVLFAVCSCGNPNDIAMSGGKVENMQMKSFREVTFYASVNVDNPTGFSFEICDIYFDVTYSSQLIGYLTAEPVSVLAHTNERHATLCSLKLDERVPVLELLKYLKNLSPEHMIIDGVATVKLKSGMKKTINVYHESLKDLIYRYENSSNTDILNNVPLSQ